MNVQHSAVVAYLSSDVRWDVQHAALVAYFLLGCAMRCTIRSRCDILLTGTYHGMHKMEPLWHTSEKNAQWMYDVQPLSHTSDSVEKGRTVCKAL